MDSPTNEAQGGTSSDMKVKTRKTSKGEKSPKGFTKFFTRVTGNTLGCHERFTQKLKSSGLKEVDSRDCDVIVAFCPITSRVGTDVECAMQQILVGKPVIFVVMHHTDNPNVIIADSRPQASGHDVILTVDCLFHESAGLFKCPRNDNAIKAVVKAFKSPHPVVPRGSEGKESPETAGTPRGNPVFTPVKAGDKGRKKVSKFWSFLAGNTCKAEEKFEQHLMKNSFKKSTPEKCHVVLAFCPVICNTQSDTMSAMQIIPDGKLVILVRLHPNCNKNSTMCSHTQDVTKENVLLTVDCLFHETQGLLDCQLNKEALEKVVAKLRNLLKNGTLRTESQGNRQVTTQPPTGRNRCTFGSSGCFGKPQRVSPSPESPVP